MNAKFYVKPGFFDEKPFVIIENGSMSVSLFRFSSGVEAIRLQNTNGELIILPYKGMQIWRASFLGHDLTMRTMFDEPAASNEFLKTYGGFMVHCGLTGIGSPSAGDKHAQHGELPNAPFNSAWIQPGMDENGKYIIVSGTYRHVVGFTVGYAFTVNYKLYEDASAVTTSIEIENLRDRRLPYMYLCHANFIPVNGSRLLDTARREAGSYKVHDSGNGEKITAWINTLREDLSAQYTIGCERECYDPEVCVTLGYIPDENGFAHTMQILPDGYAHFISHPVEALPVPVRWISRTGDEDALGMALPATAEHLGYSNAEKKGQIKFVEPKGRISFTLEAGLLEPENVKLMTKKIESARLLY